MARILLHTLVFSPDGVSTAYLMTDLAHQLNRLGHQVTVLTTTPHYNIVPSVVKAQHLKPVYKGLLYKSDYNGITVWHVAIPTKGEKVSGRTLDYLRFHFASLLLGVTPKIGVFDVVIAPSPPLSIGVIAWMLAKCRKAISIYNVQEIYPDFAVNQGILRNPTMISLMQRLEKFVYSKNTAVVPISEWFRRTLAARGIPKEKMFVISNSVDTELYRPLPRQNAFSKRHDLLNKFVVLYGGNIGLSQDWESFLFAANEHRHLPIQFVVVGDGVRRTWLEKEVLKRNLGNVSLLGYHPREMMPLINASCDLATIPMKATTTADTFPSKIYTIMACSKPCLVSADYDSELAWIVQKSGAGHFVPPDEPQAYSEAILQAFIARDTLGEQGRLGRTFVEQEYSKEAVAFKYDQLVKKLMARRQQ